MFDKIQYKLWKHLNKKMISNSKYIKSLGKISDITTMEKTDKKGRLNVFLTGLGWSGNTAVKDFFLNFKQVAVLSNEFDIFRATPWHIGSVPGPMDIVRKFSRNEDITQDVELFRAFYYLLGIHWYADFDKKYFLILDELNQIFLNFSKCFKKTVELAPHRIAALPEWTKKLTSIVSSSMNDLLNSYYPEKQIGFFRHGIRSWESIDTQLPFLPPTCRIIVTQRDPRDSWADMVQNKDWFSKYGTSIEQFIEGRKNEYRSLATSSNHVMHINFEDLCLHYSKTRKKLMDFVGLDENAPLNDTVYFDPNKSAKNIGIYKTFEDQDDIRKIEKALPEYLYKDEIQ